MTNYQYLIDLFTGILEHSKAMEGRFYVGTRYGLQDINYDELGQVFDSIRVDKKYPLVMMAPPHSFDDDSTGKIDGWEEFRMTLFFCKQSFVENIHVHTKTSTHGIPQDWHDMKRCAVNFRRALVNLQRSTNPTPFMLVKNKPSFYVPFSNIGIDRVSGVRYDFSIKLNSVCEIEDYDEYPEILNIVLDGHPEHKL